MPEHFAHSGKPVSVLLARVSDRSQTTTGRSGAAVTPAVTAAVGRVEAAVRSHGGRVLKHIGTGVLAAYESIEKAITNAVALQGELDASAMDSKTAGPSLRVGICQGSMVLSGTDVGSDAVEMTTRLVVMAGPGEIFLAANVHGALPSAMQLATRRIREDATCGTVYEYVWRQEDMTFRPMQATRGDVVTLEVTFNCERFEIGPQRPRLTIGRTTDNDIAIAQRYVSRYHTEILLRGDKFVLHDQSTNGTFLRPESGEKVAIRREEFTLTGSGRIFVGSEAAEPITYRVKSTT